MPVLAELALQGAVVAVAATGCLRLRFTRRAEWLQPSSGELARSLLAGAVAAALTTYAFMAQPGIPAFRHDWVWPVDDYSARHVFDFFASNWAPGAFGQPKQYPTLYPMFALSEALAKAGGTRFALATLMWLIELAALAGTYVWMRGRLAAAPRIAAVGGFLYALSPFVVDKTVAGHLHILVAYALLPVTASLRATATRRAELSARFVLLWLSMTIALAMTLSDIPFFAFTVGVLAAESLCASDGRAALTILLSAALAAIVTSAQPLYHLFLNTSGTNVGAGGSNTMDWLEQGSTTTLKAIGLLSYQPAYAASRFGALGTIASDSIAFASLPLLVLGALSEEGVVVVFSLLAALILAFGTTGTMGPFSEIKEFVFSRIHALAGLREFYNFQGPYTFALATVICSACTYRGATKSAAFVRLASRTLTFVIVGLATEPFLSGALQQEIPRWHEDRSYQRFSSLLRNDASRLALLPMTGPVELDSRGFGGTDPMFYGFGGHPVLSSFHASPIVATSELLLRGGRSRAAFSLLGHFSVEWVVLRKGLYSDLPGYWYPPLFSSTWRTNQYYATILAGEPGAVRMPSIVAIRNPQYVPVVALFGSQHACVGDALEAVLDGVCKGLGPSSHSRPTILPLPAPRYYDPYMGWTRSWATSSVGLGFAETEAGIAAAGPAAAVLRFKAFGRGGLYLRCLSTRGVQVDINGVPVRERACISPVGSPPRWASPFRVARGSNTVVLVNRDGPSVVANAVLAPSARVAALATGFIYVAPIAARYRAHSWLTFSRASPTFITGESGSPVASTLVFSDSFDPRWTLTVDGFATQRAFKVDGYENGFNMPPGFHRFAIVFGFGLLDRTLELAGYAAWILIIGAFGFSAILVWARRGPRLGHGEVPCKPSLDRISQS